MKQRNASSMVVAQRDASSVVVGRGQALAPVRPRPSIQLGKYAECAAEIGTVMQDCEWSPAAKLAAGLIVAGETARRGARLSREGWLALCEAVYDGRVSYAFGAEVGPFDHYEDVG